MGVTPDELEPYVDAIVGATNMPLNRFRARSVHRDGVWIWFKESFSVEMHDMIWVIGDPHFGFPGNVCDEA